MVQGAAAEAVSDGVVDEYVPSVGEGFSAFKVGSPPHQFLHAILRLYPRTTRETPAVRLAASPRAGINLIKMAQASAYIQGRDFVNPDDIQRVYSAVMEHRVFAKDGNASTVKSILESIRTQVKIPK